MSEERAFARGEVEMIKRGEGERKDLARRSRARTLAERGSITSFLRFD
jgi:hypothetical protein